MKSVFVHRVGCWKLAALLFGVLLSAFGTPSIVAAQSPAIATNLSTNSSDEDLRSTDLDAVYSAGTPKVASFPNGDIVALWNENAGNYVGGDNKIWGSVYRTATGWGAPFLLSHPDAGWISEARIYAAPSGKAVIFWHEAKLSNGMCGQWACTWIMSAVIDPANPIVNPTVFYKINEGGAELPKVVFDPAGNGIAVFGQYIPSPERPGSGGITAAGYPCKGTARQMTANFTAGQWSTPAVYNTINNAAEFDRIAISADGNKYTVAWSEFSGFISDGYGYCTQNGAHTLYARTWTRANSSSSWSAGPVQTIPGGYIPAVVSPYSAVQTQSLVAGPHIAYDGSGSITMIWSQYAIWLSSGANSTNGSPVNSLGVRTRVTRTDSAGNWVAPVLLEDFPSDYGPAQDLSLLRTSDGSLLATWNHACLLNGNPSGGVCPNSRLMNGSGFIGPQMILQPPSPSTHYLLKSIDSTNGNISAFFLSGPFDKEKLGVRKFTSAGGWSAEYIHSDPALPIKYTTVDGSMIASLGANRAVVAVAQNAINVTQYGAWGRRMVRALIYDLSAPTPTPTPTNTATRTPTSTPTRTSTAAPTVTPIPPTKTPTPSPTALFTSTATRTPTPIPPTATSTSTPVQTSTPIPTSVPTLTPTRTSTPISTTQPSQTPTRTATPSATSTVPAPTATAQATNTQSPQATATPDPTQTPDPNQRREPTPEPTVAPQTSEQLWMGICQTMTLEQGALSRLNSMLKKLERLRLGGAQLSRLQSLVTSINNELSLLVEFKPYESYFEWELGAERAARISTMLDAQEFSSEAIVPQECEGTGRRVELGKTHFAICSAAEELLLARPSGFNADPKTVAKVRAKLKRLTKTLGLIGSELFSEPTGCKAALNASSQVTLRDSIRRLKKCGGYFSLHPVERFSGADEETLVRLCLSS